MAPLNGVLKIGGVGEQKLNKLKSMYIQLMKWLELDDRTNVPALSEENAQENCKPFPNSVVSIKPIPPKSS